MPAVKPELPKLTTPVSATFPSEAVLSAKSATASAHPQSAKPLSAPCHDLPMKTPITPPTAYTDFLKSMYVTSPGPASTRESSSGETDEHEEEVDSAPSTASSEQTNCSCKCERPHNLRSTSNNSSNSGRSLRGPATAPFVPPSPFSQLPMSAPPTGADSFPSLKIPPSPAFSHVDSPMSSIPPTTATTARSPFSARSPASAFDWDAALKARFAEKKKKKASSRTSVRHIREVVTRTVTYSPTTRINPAPKGKRRKVEHAPTA